MHKILIIDNSTHLLEVMKRILERNGYIIKTMNTPAGIYGEIDNFRPDLLILDIYLSDEDGRHICKKIKTNFQTRFLPIILFSAFPNALEEYKIYLADDFMQKPFDIKTLLNKIKLLLRSELIIPNDALQ